MDQDELQRELKKHVGPIKGWFLAAIATTNSAEECMAERYGGACCGHPGMCLSEGWDDPDS